MELWQIVPANDGYTYLCVNESSGCFLAKKAHGLIRNDKIFFKTQEEAQAFVDANFAMGLYTAERFCIDEDFWIKTGGAT